MTDTELLGNILEAAEIDDTVKYDLRQLIDHGGIVRRLAVALSRELNKSKEFCDNIAIAGVYHDIGKLKLSKYLYGRDDDVLDIEELKYVRMHAALGCEMLKKLRYNDMILSAVYHHHENFDGSGYPDNLKGEQIPEGARILRVCDVFAALTSVRPYREAFEVDAAFDMLIEENKNFDMKVFLALQRFMHSDEFEPFHQIIKEANYRILEKSRLVYSENK